VDKKVESVLIKREAAAMKRNRLTPLHIYEKGGVGGKVKRNFRINESAGGTQRVGR